MGAADEGLMKLRALSRVLRDMSRNDLIVVDAQDFGQSIGYSRRVVGSNILCLGVPI